MKRFLKSSFGFLAPLMLVGVLFEWQARRMYTAETNLAYQARHFRERCPSVRLLVLGNSHGDKAVNPEDLCVPAFNMAFASQDSYYDAQILARSLASMPRLRYLVLVLSPFSFGWDEASISPFLLVDYHRRLGIPPRDGVNAELLFNHSLLFRHRATFLGDWFKGKRPRGKTAVADSAAGAPPSWEGELLTAKGYRLAQGSLTGVALQAHAVDRARLHQQTCFDGTRVEENLDLLAHAVQRALNRKVRVLLLLPPYTPAYLSALEPSFLARYYETAARLAAWFDSAEVTLLDLTRSPEFTDEDFFNSDHLNVHGAVKIATVLNGWIEDGSVPVGVEVSCTDHR